jgi:hypothetical protein
LIDKVLLPLLFPMLFRRSSLSPAVAVVFALVGVPSVAGAPTAANIPSATCIQQVLESLLLLASLDVPVVSLSLVPLSALLLLMFLLLLMSLLFLPSLLLLMPFYFWCCQHF